MSRKRHVFKCNECGEHDTRATPLKQRCTACQIERERQCRINWNHNHKEKVNEASKKYQRNHKDAVNKKHTERHKKRWASDPEYRIRTRSHRRKAAKKHHNVKKMLNRIIIKEYEVAHGIREAEA